MSTPEKEFELLLGDLLKGTPFYLKTFAVGGYLRDELLNTPSKDLDIVVNLKNGAENLTKFIHDSFPNETSTPRVLGAGYPIWYLAFKEDVNRNGMLYHTKGAGMDFADTQKESFPDPNSRQRITEFGTLKEDIERRDFTVNMLLRNLSTCEFKDVTGTSGSDIKNGILRGHPEVSLDKIFTDDPLRMLRLVRFQAKFNWHVPLSVLKTVKRNAYRIEIVSGERIRDELIKIMLLGKLDQAIRLMETTRLVEYIFPEIDLIREDLPIFKYTKSTVEAQLSALLHEFGTEISDTLLRRLKFDLYTINKVNHLIENWVKPLQKQCVDNPKSIKKLLRSVGVKTVNDILDLAEGHVLGRSLSNTIPELRKKIEEVQKIPIREKPILNGEEIMELLNIKPGPMIKNVMIYLQSIEDDYAINGEELSKKEAKELVLDAKILIQ